MIEYYYLTVRRHNLYPEKVLLVSNSKSFRVIFAEFLPQPSESLSQNKASPVCEQ